MSDPILRLQTLIRAELAVAQIHANRTAARSVLITVALIFGLMSLSMLNIAGYFALSPTYGSALAALFTALVNLVLVIIILLVARNAGPSENEEKLAQELRELAYTELNNDIEPIKAEFEKISNDVKMIRSGFSSLTSSAMGVAPVIKTLISMLKH